MLVVRMTDLLISSLLVAQVPHRKIEQTIQ